MFVGYFGFFPSSHNYENRESSQIPSEFYVDNDLATVRIDKFVGLHSQSSRLIRRSGAEMTEASTRTKSNEWRVGRQVSSLQEKLL